VLLRLAYLAVTNTFAALRLLPTSDRDKDTEILLLRHQVTVLHRQLNGARVTFRPEDCAFLAGLPRVLRSKPDCGVLRTTAELFDQHDVPVPSARAANILSRRSGVTERQ
jgi:hypothetical protein